MKPLDRDDRPRTFPHLTLLAVLACVPLLNACTSQAWYEGSRASARQQRNQQAPGAYEDCMRRVIEGVGSKSYDSYEREREELRRK